LSLDIIVNDKSTVNQQTTFERYKIHSDWIKHKKVIVDQILKKGKFQGTYRRVP